MFYIFHGEDEFLRSEAIADLKKKMGDAAWLDLNTTILDGRKLALSELVHACDAVPFFGDRRLVIVHGLLARFDPRTRKKGEGQQGEPEEANESEESGALASFAEDLLTYLARVPGTTRLVFAESRALKPTNPVLHYAEGAAKKQAFVKEFTALKARDLDAWIEQRVRASGGSITSSAIKLLGMYLGNDLRLVDTELNKLLTFSGPGQPITDGTVRQLVAAVRESSAFDLVDTLSLRDRTRALALLEELLDAGQAPAYLMTMIARQFRILIQIRELEGQNASPEQIRQRTGLHSFVIEKGLRQARNFGPATLEAIYGRLVELDAAIKTGRVEPRLGLEMLVTELSGPVGLDN